jgi:hypothetical protein
MSIATIGRRAFLVASVALLAGFQPIPVPLHVSNESTKTIRVRTSSAEAWVAVGPLQTVELTHFSHAGLCRPRDRWLPESFHGLQLELPDGSVIGIDRAAFEAEASYARERWTYRYRGT